MPAQQQHFITTAYLSGSTGELDAGSVVCLSTAAAERYVLSSAANRALYSKRSAGIILNAGDDENPAVELQTVGVVPNRISGLGSGTASLIRVSSDGVLERTSTYNAADDVCGHCDADGNAYVCFPLVGVNLGSGTASPGGGIFGEDLAHFWGGRYDDSTGTWIDEAGDEDADNVAAGIPTEDTINGHTFPTFDGVNDSLSAGVVDTLDGLSSYCIFACFNAGDDAFGSVLEQALQFGIQFVSQTVLVFVNSGSGSNYMQGTSTIDDSRWHRVILNVDAGAASLYVDGVLEDTSTFSAISASALNTLRFGVSGSGVFYEGGITACGIATRAATVEEVLLLDAGLANWVGGGDATSFRGVPLANDTPMVGGSWVYDGTNYVLKKPAPEGWQDAQDYGAVGTDTDTWDGVTDHTAYLQAALDAPSKGGRLHIPSGNYFITAELETPANATEIAGSGSPYNLDHAVVIHAVASMRSILKVTGRTQIRNLVLDCDNQADYGILRHEDSLSRYENVMVFNAALDGIHAIGVEDGFTISAVSLTGTSPLVVVEGDPDPVYGGSYQLDITSATEFTVDVPTAGTVGPFTIPTSGSRVVSIPLSTLGYGIRLKVTFPAGTYSGGDFYTWTITGNATINDGVSFVQCVARQCGTVHATSGFRGGVRALSELTGRSIRNALVSGTVDITSGSQLVEGTGTTFRSLGARPGDYIRIGAYPDWEASNAYIIGDMVVGTARPGQAYVWRCTSGGTSDSDEPTWPLETDGIPGSMPIHEGTGVEVTDGGVTWECWNPLVFQIINVLDDATIVLNQHMPPHKTLTGLDYAVCVGSGWFSEVSTDANTNVLDNCVAVSNAACGVATTAQYGDKFYDGQYTENGVAGISVGIGGAHSVWNTVGIATYMEGNICANWILAGNVAGIDLVRVELSAYATMPILDCGAGDTFGQLVSSRDNLEKAIARPLGTASDGFSDVAVTRTASGRVFRVRGSWALTTTDSFPALSDTLDPSTPILQINATGTFTSNPTIAPGDYVGQMVELFNYGTTSWALDATKGMTLEKEITVIESTNSIRFFWDGSTWRQLGAVGRGANRAFTWSLSVGANEDIDNPGGEKVNVSGVAGNFEIGSIDAGRDGQVLTIVNLTTNDMTIKNESAGTASGRIKTGTGGDVVITGSSGFSSARLMYVTASTRWILLGKNP